MLGLALAARRASITGWLVAGLLVLAGLFVPTSQMFEDFGNISSLAGTIYKVTLYILPSIALILAAALLYRGFSRLAGQTDSVSSGQDVSPDLKDHAGSLAAACLVLSGLLILKTLHNLYWLTVWDATYDPLGYFLIVVPVLVAIFSGALLLINLRRWAVLAGLGYLVLIPGLLIAVSTSAQRVDFRQLTEARAAQVSRWVEAFHARHGQYPEELRQVKPWYAASLPGPFIMYGQDWCYLAGEGYYQLGYVDREHWSSPELIRQVYKSIGTPPETESICGEEIEALMQQDAMFYEP
jgi:hypothetical protein